MSLLVSVRPRLRKGSKVDIYHEAGKKLLGVIDNGETREVNPIPDDERFEFDWIAENFIQNEELLKAQYHELEKLRLYIDSGLLKALEKIAALAKQNDVTFEPYKKALMAIFREAKKAEGEISHRTGKKLDLLGRYRELLNIEQEKGPHNENPISSIVSELMAIDHYYTQFNDIAAKHYDKKTHSVERKHFKWYLDGTAEPSKWVYAVALEVLAANKVDVFDIGLDPKMIIDTWFKMNTKRCADQGALKAEFANVFKPSKGIMALLK